MLFIIFAETGLFFGFFLPGDNLVFISGMYCATKPHVLQVHILILILLMSAAAILGNLAGYYFGRRVGEALYNRPDSFFFKQRHVQTTRVFYDKYGGKALFWGRFLPVIRTFAPILAGVIKVDFKKFMLYNVAGGLCWIGSICCIGYFLGVKFPQLENYVGYIFIGLIILTSIPIAVTWLRQRKR